MFRLRQVEVRQALVSLPARTALAAATGLAVVMSAMRLLLARHESFCGTPDACFYLGMAQTLGSGKGFTARFLYDYQQASLRLPNTGLEYWRPGVSFLLLLSRPFGGVSLKSSVLLTTLVAVVFAATAWHLARHSGGSRWLALLSFALCLTLPPVWVGSLTPDSGLYYGAAVAWFLALFTVKRQGIAQDVLALLCVAFAYLIRNDAALLLFPLLAVLWARHRRRAAGGSVRYSLLVLIGFALALVPMHVLYRLVLHTAFPSGTARTLFFDQLSDFNRYGSPLDLHSLLALGMQHLVLQRAVTLASILYRVPALMLGYPALLFLPVLLLRSKPGATQDLEQPAALPEVTGPLSFLLVLLLIYALALPAIGGFAALRSALALMPWLAVLVIAAMQRAARNPAIALLLGAMLIAVNTVSGVMGDLRDVAAANLLGEADRASARALRATGANPASALVLTNDPVQFHVTTSFPTAPIPSNGMAALAQAAADLHATHVLLDLESPPAPPAEIASRLHATAAVPVDGEHALILVLPAAQTGMAR